MKRAVINIIIIIFFFTFKIVLLAENNSSTLNTPSMSSRLSSQNDQTSVSDTQKKSNTSSGSRNLNASSSQKSNNQSENQTKEWIKKTILYGIHDDRIDAIKKIMTLKQEENKSEMINLLNEIMPTEKNPEVKRNAITVVSELKSESSIPWIIQALEDTSEEVRIEAVYAIERLKAYQAIPQLIQILKERDFTQNSNYTEALIRTLGKLKATELKDFAIEHIKDTKTNDNIRQLFVLFLGDIEDISSKDFLLDLVKNKDEDITLRSYAVAALAKLGAKETASDIAEILKEIDSYPVNKRKDYYSFSMYCTVALVKLGDNSAIPRLMDALRSNNATIRLRAIELLKELKDKRTIDILRYKMQYDPSQKVQKAAKEALKEMGENVDE